MSLIETKNNYHVDKNNNKWSIKLYTRKQAIKYSKSLFNCKNCTNCIGCNNCKDCSDCTNCINCINCNYCINCKDCNYCIGCNTCKDCKNCTYCINCKNCTYCINCKDCNYCINCKNCKDCINCKNCTYQKMEKIMKKIEDNAIKMHKAIRHQYGYRVKSICDDIINAKIIGKNHDHLIVGLVGASNVYIATHLLPTIDIIVRIQKRKYIYGE